MNHTYVYDHYYKYDEITEILKKYSEQYPAYTELDSIGRTPEGREQWIMKVTNTQTGGFEEKPALYVEGNIPLFKKASWVVRGKKGDVFEIVCDSGKAGKVTASGIL